MKQSRALTKRYGAVHRSLPCGVAAFVILLSPVGAVTAEPAPDVVGDTTISVLTDLLEVGPRFIGLPGHQRAAQIIKDRLGTLGAGRLITHDATQVVPVVDSASITLGDGTQFVLHPMWPNGARLCTTPFEGLVGRLIYAGDGHERALPAKALAGAVVAMEYNSYDRWKQVFEMGAAAVLFLPPKQTSWVHSHGKFADIPFNAPRYYVQNEQLAGLIRTGNTQGNVRIESAMRWAPRPVHSLIWVVDGSDANWRDQVVVFTARYDASGAVPQLAYGAEQAVSAAALIGLAEAFDRRPPARTAVLIWTGADTMNFASLRAILGAARASDADADVALQDARASRETLSRQIQDISNDARRALLTEAAIRDRYERQIKRRFVSLRKSLFRYRKVRESDARPSEAHEALEREKEKLNTLQVALQRNIIRDLDWIDLLSLTERVTAQIDAERIDAEAAVSRLERDNRFLRPILDRDRVVALIAIELTSHGPAFGVYWQTDWLRIPVERLTTQCVLGQRLVGRHKANRDTLTIGLSQGFLADTFSGDRDWHSDIRCPLTTASDIAQHFGYVSLAFITAQDGRWHVDSPLDRREHLDVASVARQAAHVVRLGHRAANSEQFQITNRLLPKIAAIRGQAVTLSHGDARLNLGLSGRLVTANSVRPIPRVVGTRWMSVQQTDATGKYEFSHLSDSTRTTGFYVVDVVGLDDAGRIVEAANHAARMPTYPFSSRVNLGADVTGAKSVMFDCAMKSIAGLRDPRNLRQLHGVSPLLQRTRDAPRYFALRAADGLASVMLKPGEKWMLRISHGTRGVRLLMIGADESEPMGRGFDLDESTVAGRSAVVHAAGDFFQLNRHRLDVIEKFGVASHFTVELQDQTLEHLDRAETAYNRDNGAESQHHWRAAVAIQQEVYRQVLSIGDDLVVAVIFILLVSLPFSFYTERFVINAATVYGRLTGFSAVFLLMMGLLYSFHPAFRITTTPLIVLLSFVLIVLSSVVTFILYMRFIEHLDLGVGGEHSASLSRLNVVGRAMVVGVSNLRRRKIRSCFTIVTLIVMTFALLSLSGTHTEMLEKRFAISDPERTGPLRPSYQGIQLTQVGWKPMPAWFLDQIEAQFGDTAYVGGQFWLLPEPSTYFEPYVIVARDGPGGPAVYRLTAVMGVSALEDRFLELDPTTATLFERLSDEPDGCLLPQRAADELQVKPGDAVRLGGRDFRVSGIFDEQRMQRLRYLTGQRYGPIDLKTYSLINDPPHVEPKTEEQMLEPSNVQGDVLLQPMRPHEFALIGNGAARDMGAKLRSVCIVPDRPELLDNMAHDLSMQRLVPLYRASGDEVHVIATRRQVSIVGLRDLVIPLLIGALIVINTMINAVSDQRSTIYVYTSLGLAPVHVGVLFLSEAAALGTLGVVGGYVLGQGFATAARAAGLLETLTLNYSSTAVVITMGLVMGIVFLSAIYPVRLATRLAVPAESARWEVPAPTSDSVRMELPFNVSDLTAKGASAFLHEWLRLHTESGVGQFISDNASVFCHGAIRGVRASVWLSPFDLGVSQRVQIEITPETESCTSDSESMLYQVIIEMTRQSGQRSTWIRSMRGFVAELRKQFLLWRALTHDRQLDYIKQSETLLNGEST